MKKEYTLDDKSIEAIYQVGKPPTDLIVDEAAPEPSKTANNTKHLHIIQDLIK